MTAAFENLTYITRTAVPSGAAMSMQIRAMSNAYHHHLGGRFRLVAGPAQADCGPPPDCRRHSIRVPGAETGRYAAAVMHALVAARRREFIITRDIAVAAAAVTAGGRAIYESHKQPLTRGCWILHRLIAANRRLQIVTNTRALAAWYERRWPALRGRVLPAHNGVYPETFDEARAEGRRTLRAGLGLDPTSTVVVHTGSIYEGRGAELFGEIAKLNPAITFVQIGGSAADAARWAGHYRRIGAANVRFVERQATAQVRRWQVAADLLFYVITRRAVEYWTTSPLKIFEYMASGTPIIAARIGSVGEILSEDNAYCYDPEDPTSLRRAMAAFLANPEAGARRAARARAAALENYDWRTRAARILAFAAMRP